MKIGKTKNLPGRFGDECYKKIKSFGYDAVDMQFAVTEAEIYSLPEEELRERLEKEKALALDAGITINQAHGPWRCPPFDATEEDRAERMEKMKKCLHMCNILGCPYMIIHPIMPMGTNDIGTGNEEETFRLNVEFMKELTKAAKEEGVTVCYENMPFTKFSLSKPEEILKVVEAVNDENFRVCLDTGHVLVFPELDLAEETKRLGSYIKTVHIHDNDGKTDCHRIPYFGIANWEAFGKALKETGFDGVFSFETDAPWELPGDIYGKMITLMCEIGKEITKKK